MASSLTDTWFKDRFEVSVREDALSKEKTPGVDVFSMSSHHVLKKK